MRYVLGLLVLAGCATVTPLAASAVQPHPRGPHPSTDTPGLSEELYIYTPFGRLTRVRNSARFVAVTRDLVRVHVGVYGDTADWKVWLEDDGGHRYDPETREVATNERWVLPWWNVKTRRCCGSSNETPQLRYGTADYVFRGDSLMGPERTSLVLHVERAGVRPLRYAWTFGEGHWIHHGYSREHDPEYGFLPIPGPGCVKLASTFDPTTMVYLPRE
jgi:hypothetical protein